MNPRTLLLALALPLTGCIVESRPPETPDAQPSIVETEEQPVTMGETPKPPAQPVQRQVYVELERGDRVFVKWHGAWYAARVISISPNGDARIHYIGYSHAWDETVAPHRVRITQPS